MDTTMIFRMGLVIAGILFLWVDFIAYAKQKLTENIGLGWALFSVGLILAGAVPKLGVLLGIGSGNIDGLLLLFGVFLLVVVFVLSSTVSTLRIRNRELAMQVSLLNQENEKILKEISILSGRKETVNEQNGREK